jgi:hypothetical protein
LKIERLMSEFQGGNLPSIRTARDDLQLERVDVVYPGEHTFPLADRVRALALPRLYEDLEPLG